MMVNRQRRNRTNIMKRECCKWKRLKTNTNANKSNRTRTIIKMLWNWNKNIRLIGNSFWLTMKENTERHKDIMRKDLNKWNKIFNWNLKLIYINLSKGRIYILINLLKIMKLLLRIWGLITTKLQGTIWSWLKNTKPK